MTSETDVYNRTTTYSYDTIGNITSQKFHVYEINYDSKGSTTNVKVGTQNLVSYSYTTDVNHLLSTASYGNGQMIEYVYSGSNIIGIKLDGAADYAFEYSYDEEDNMTQKLDHINNLKTEYSGETVTVSTINSDGTFTPVHTYGTSTVDEINQFAETTNGITFTVQRLENLDKFIINDTLSLNKSFIKDADGKLTSANIFTKANGIDTNILSTSFAYSQTNASQLETITHTYGGNTTSFSYTYDDKGNISSVTSDGFVTRYKYDSLNQLVRVDDSEQNKTFTYSYDLYGNILSKSEYALTAADIEPTNPVSTKTYGYGDSNWTDKFTSYNGQAITYDASGNPLTYDGWTFVWEAGRQLKRMTKSGSTVDYKYDDSGIRTSKTVNGVTTNYTTIDGRITSQSDGTNFLYFRYDSNDELIGAQINGTEYIYLRNLQGDVTSILDANGQSVVKYTYDAWGKVVSITGSLADTIGQLNPMRYRGYYYDSETGRFLNADDSAILPVTKSEAVGHNLFAYCGNNPVGNVDPSGALGEAVLRGIVGKGISNGFNSNIKQPIVKRNKTQQEKKDFAIAIYLRAKKDYPKTKIPPEIMAGQACYESGYGTSPAAVNNYNLFGIKPSGKIAKYKTIEESILRYEYVLTLPYYKNLYKLTSVYDWTMKIGPAGYCPDKGYGNRLWSTIKTLKSWGVFR